MPRPHPALAALAAFALLAGCVADAPAPAATAAPETVLVTKANDVESLTNESFAMAAHVHDYWGGQDRLVVVDDARDAWGPWLSDGWSERFVPADGVVVPQGTARVEVTATWTDESPTPFGTPELWVKTAADAEAVLVGPLEQGVTLSVPATLAQADLPHQALSAWRFEWRIPESDLPLGLVVWSAEVSLKAEAVRGLDIPVYPPHPDLWRGADALPLMEAGQEGGVWVIPAGLCNFGCRKPHHPNGTVVPYDAAMVEVVLRKGPDSPTDLGLHFHGADSREWREPAPSRSEGGALTYLLPVEPGMGDSPYATQSLWAFQVYVSGPARESAKAGSYVIEARVLR